MQASHQRTLRDGREYERFFPARELENTNPVLLQSGDTFDTLNEMEKIIRRYQADTAGVAPLLVGQSLRETCRNNWEFAYHHFQYKLDAAGVEQLRRPLRAWKDRRSGIDCDCFSILLSTILLNQGIPHKLRKAKYNGHPYFQHIYVIVPEKLGSRRYITLDPVVDSFDYETPTSGTFDKLMMPIQLLNGVPGIGAVTGAGIGAATGAGIGAVPNPGFGAEFVGFGSETLSGIGLGDVPGGLTLAAAGQDMLDRLRLHLQNTLTQLRGEANPSLQDYVGRIAALLDVWHRPAERDAILAHLAAEEQGLSGTVLGNFFSSVKNGVQQAAGWVKDGVDQAANWVKDNGAQVFNQVMKYNPLATLVRNAVLLAMKINLFRFAERLGYGYASQAQAQTAGLDLVEWNKVRDQLGKLESIHLALGGDLDPLRTAILTGMQLGNRNHNTPVVAGLSGLGLEPVSATAGTAAATSIFAKLAEWLKVINWGKLFQAAVDKAGSLLSKKPDTNYTATVPPNYVAPTSEQEYLSNQARFDNPKSASSSSGAGIALVGVGVAALLLVPKPS